MALEKIIEDDKYEIVTEYKHIQIRTATIIKDDGVIIKGQIIEYFKNKSLLIINKGKI